jgi:hypothetical protein
LQGDGHKRPVRKGLKEPPGKEELLGPGYDRAWDAVAAADLAAVRQGHEVDAAAVAMSRS